MCDYIQTMVYNINKSSMDFCVSKLILMETNMSKEVGEHFIHLCIPKFTYQRHLQIEVLKLLWRCTQVITKARLHTQLVCIDHGP
jgi:hypothetical protein